MRVQNGAVESPFNTTRSEAAQNVGAESRLNAQSAGNGSADRVSLSNAAGLVSLAKSMMPAEKQAKVDAVAAQFRSGQYESDDSEVSHAIVQGHIQG